MTHTSEPLILFGASGHARSVIDVIHAEGRYKILGLIDSFQSAGTLVSDYAILGAESDLPALMKEHACVNLFVAVGDNYQRQAISQRLAGRLSTLNFVTSVHPSAVISPDAALGSGVVVAPGVVINTGSVIADGCLVNTRSSIDHNCQLQPFSSVAPGATLSGNVTVGERASIGLGACVLNRITIGKDTVIGAGAVVVRDIPESSVAFGVPCRVVRSRSVDEPYLD